MKKTNSTKIVSSSFRDPSGFLFYHNGLIYRQINSCYQKDYDYLMSSGLYESLVNTNLLIPHREVNLNSPLSEKLYKVIQPEQIPFISYPYEWCFSQLKHAALITLEIQEMAINFGLSLKDCSAYNIQFNKCKPVLIDTLSFEKYKEGEAWIAYRQFCQHFLAPLLLMVYKDIRLNQLLRIYIDGIPLDLTSTILQLYSYFNLPSFFHIHLHSKSQKHFADKALKKQNRKMSRTSFLGLIDSLKSAVKKLKLKNHDSEWANYYDNTNYGSNAFDHKKNIVSDLLDKENSKKIWDIGANAGVFSRIAGNKGGKVISFDIDPIAIEKNYLECVRNNATNILPLLIDLENPSPGIGWKNRERMSLIERGPTDLVIALALIHHLAISNNLPFNKIASFFYTICNTLIIEFIPKTDSKVHKLLSTRQDIFPEYNQRDFEHSFSRYFAIEFSKKIVDSDRIIYLMKKRVSS